ncbi:hypothetical protein [Streptomyces sp. R44]|uniref:Uncharacterized protein n=1 Tax=Streptomyces sp. R44 TaxID=3238633 RepID=A0AB39T8Q3_9ACTN
MQKSYRALITATAAAVLGIAGTATATAAPASATAHPTGCTNSYYKGSYEGMVGWQASCSKSNGGRYKAVVICTPYLGGKDVVLEPTSWQTSGKSYVFCPAFTIVKSGGITTRGY